MVACSPWARVVCRFKSYQPDFLTKLLLMNNKWHTLIVSVYCTFLIFYLGKIGNSLQLMSDRQLQGKAVQLIKRKGTLPVYSYKEYILLFALLQETSKRFLNIQYYPIQLKTALFLINGVFSELKPGEGKTISLLIASYCNGLLKKSTHLVTSNDYLAKRDYESLSPVLNFLGLTTGLIIPGLSKPIKYKNYRSHILFSTGTELCFDFLKDKVTPTEKIQPILDSVLIDEADSIMIDESQTPLVLAEPRYSTSSLVYQILKAPALSFKTPELFYSSNKESLNLTRASLIKAEANLSKVVSFPGLSITDFKNSVFSYYLFNLVSAYHLFKLNRHYIKSNSNSIVLIDPATGRPLADQTYSKGLQQAIEYKENLKSANTSSTLAELTFQNFFKLYSQVGGLSATLNSAHKEFGFAYSIFVKTLKPYLPEVNRNFGEVVFLNKSVKLDSLVAQVFYNSKAKKPSLVNTENVKDANLLSEELTKKGIKNTLLTPNRIFEEKILIKKVMVPGSVTIASKLVSRGTDVSAEAGFRNLLNAASGLCVLSFEKIKNTRLETQLLGRTSRQGNPGTFVSFVSLDEPIFYMPLVNSVISNKLAAEKIVSNTNISKTLFSYLIKRIQAFDLNQILSSKETTLKLDSISASYKFALWAFFDQLAAFSYKTAQSYLNFVQKTYVLELLKLHLRKSNPLSTRNLFVSLPKSDKFQTQQINDLYAHVLSSYSFLNYFNKYTFGVTKMLKVDKAILLYNSLLITQIYMLGLIRIRGSLSLNKPGVAKMYNKYNNEAFSLLKETMKLYYKKIIQQRLLIKL